jgi:hypothetical protein
MQWQDGAVQNKLFSWHLRFEGEHVLVMLLYVTSDATTSDSTSAIENVLVSCGLCVAPSSCKLCQEKVWPQAVILAVGGQSKGLAIAPDFFCIFVLYVSRKHWLLRKIGLCNG